MKISTINKLNIVAKVLTKAFIDDMNIGHTTESDILRLKAEVKLPTEMELMKAALLHDKTNVISGVRMVSGIDMTNVFKTRQQLNYVINEVNSALRRKQIPLLKRAIYS